MGRRKTADISAQEFRFRLLLVAKSRGITLNQLHRDAKAHPRHTRDIISRNKNPTFKLIRRLIEPQNVTVAAFIGDLKTLAMSLTQGERDGLDKSIDGASTPIWGRRCLLED